MKTCPFCGTELTDDCLFCTECGKNIPQGKVCSHCGTAISEEDIFCANCGKKVVGESTGIRLEESSHKCPYCGTIIHDGDAFCQNCGKKVDNRTSTISENNNNHPEPEISDSGDEVTIPLHEETKDKALSHTDNNEEESELFYEEEPKSQKKNIYYTLGGILIVIIIAACIWNYYTSVQRADRERAIADSLAIVHQDSLRQVREREKEKQDSINEVRKARQLIIDSYVRLIEDYNKKNDEDWGEYYFLKDITGDDIPELWIQANTETESSTSGYSLSVYTIKKGIPISIFEGHAGHPSHHSYHEGDNYILKWYAHMGAASWTKYEYINGKIRETEIFNQESIEDADDYKRPSEPEVNTYELSNTEQIKVCIGLPDEGNNVDSPVNLKEEKDVHNNDVTWLQGHWIYEQGNYKAHIIIDGNKVIQYSTMNPEKYEKAYTINGDELHAKLIDGMDLVIKIDFANQRIDYGDGQWMHKISSSDRGYSSGSSNTLSTKFLGADYVVGYLANHKFTDDSGLDIRFDGDGRIYIDGDCAGVVSVLRWNETSALLRYGGGAYGEGKIAVTIEGNGRMRLTDPVDGTVWYQK